MNISSITHFLEHGLLEPSFVFLVVYTLISFGVSLLSISCYLHRSQTHRAVFFIWPITFLFRLSVWLLTATVTKEWVAVHRKHHEKCDTPDDPHSPRYFGLKKILFEGADIYHNVAKKNPELLKQYGAGTPDDWFEKMLFSRGTLGIVTSFVVQFILFGAPAIVVWALQMLVMPVVAAGFINGITHVYGYQTYKDGFRDKYGKVFERIGDARNVPTYLIALGEEFHNNHHAYQWRYKFSHKWYEFDLAGTFIELLTWVGFAWVPRKMK